MLGLASGRGQIDRNGGPDMSQDGTTMELQTIIDPGETAHLTAYGRTSQKLLTAAQCNEK